MGITKTKYVSTFMFFPLYFEDHLESSRLRIGSSTESPISYEIQDILYDFFCKLSILYFSSILVQLVNVQPILEIQGHSSLAIGSVSNIYILDCFDLQAKLKLDILLYLPKLVA